MSTAVRDAAGTMRCSFKCPVVHDADDVYASNTITLLWHPLRYYNLYIFQKTQSGQYVLCSLQDMLAHATGSLFSGNYSCTYEFARGERYFGYFSGKMLTGREIADLKDVNKKANALLEILPSGDGAVQISQSFSAFMFMAQIIGDHLPFPSWDRLPDTLLGIYDGSIRSVDGVDSDIINWIKGNRFLVLPGDKLVDMQYVIWGIKAYRSAKEKWQELIDDAKQRVNTLGNTSRLGALYNLDSAWKDAAWQAAPPLKLASAMHGLMIARKLQGKFGNDPMKLFSDCFESYFYDVDRDKNLSVEFNSIPTQGSQIVILAAHYKKDIAAHPPRLAEGIMGHPGQWSSVIVSEQNELRGWWAEWTTRYNEPSGAINNYQYFKEYPIAKLREKKTREASFGDTVAIVIEAPGMRDIKKLKVTLTTYGGTVLDDRNIRCIRRTRSTETNYFVAVVFLKHQYFLGASSLQYSRLRFVVTYQKDGRTETVILPSSDREYLTVTKSVPRLLVSIEIDRNNNMSYPIGGPHNYWGVGMIISSQRVLYTSNDGTNKVDNVINAGFHREYDQPRDWTPPAGTTYEFPAAPEQFDMEKSTNDTHNYLFRVQTNHSEPGVYLHRKVRSAGCILFNGTTNRGIPLLEEIRNDCIGSPTKTLRGEITEVKDNRKLLERNARPIPYRYLNAYTIINADKSILDWSDPRNTNYDE